MPTCKLCASLVVNTKLEYSDVLAKEHAKVHLKQVVIFDEEITVDQILEKCFPKNGNSEIGTYRKSSKYSLLVQVCRSLFPQRPRSPSRRTVLCRKCDCEKTIYTSNKSSNRQSSRPSYLLNTRTIIDHACSHLRLDLYECRKCDRQFSNSRAVREHSVRSHRLTIAMDHLETRLDDFIDEISSMIKECFSDQHVDSSVRRMSSNPGASAGLKLSDLGAKRQVLCRQLIKKLCDSNGNVQCRLCEKGIKVKKTGYYTVTMLQHALRHLQKPVEQCKICSDAFSNRSLLQQHFKKVHSVTLVNNFECHEDQFHDDIMAMLRKCYSDETNEAVVDGNPTNSAKCEARSDCKTTRGSNLKIERRMFCYTLCRKFIDRDGKIKCRSCGNRIKAKNAAGVLTSANLMGHALTHLREHGLNRCKICSKTFLMQSTMTLHLRVTHALPSTNNYEDLADQYHHEILAALSQCYDGATNSESAVGCAKEPRVRKPVYGTNLTMNLQQLCLRLIKKFAHRDGMMHCRMCSKKVRGALPGGGHGTEMVKQHALMHMGKHSVRCKHCTMTFVTLSQARVHLMKVHGTATDKSHYECLQDQFHSEIVDMIRKCYEGDA